MLVGMTGLTACSSRTSGDGNTAVQAVTAGTAETAAGTGSTAAADSGSTAAADAEEEETVSLTIPTVYESVSTQEEADEIRDRNGYISATLNDDGSLTIVMLKSDQEEMVDQFEDSVKEGMKEMAGSDSFPNITDISADDDYSEFTVTTSSTEVSDVEAMASNELVMYGTLYHIYTGNDVDNIHVDFVNADSGETLRSVDSGSLREAFESAAASDGSTVSDTGAAAATAEPAAGSQN